MANTSKKVAPVKKSASKSVTSKKTTTKVEDLTPKAIKEIKGTTVQIGEREDDTSKTTRAKKQSTKKTTTTKSKTGKKTTVDTAVSEVALKINPQFCGINLFYADRKFYTAEDKTFFIAKHIHWHQANKYWFIRLKSVDQVTEIKTHFGDRIDIPSDVNKQIADVLKAQGNSVTKAKTSTPAKTKSTKSTKTVEIPF